MKRLRPLSRYCDVNCGYTTEIFGEKYDSQKDDSRIDTDGLTNTGNITHVAAVV